MVKSLLIRIFLTLVFISSLAACSASTNVFTSSESRLFGWANRIKLTIDHTKIGVPLSNFPILIRLSQSSGMNSADLSFIFSTLVSDENRFKIAVTTSDGVTECYAEIEKWDTASRQAFIWVKVLSISNTADTILYLYYDKTHEDNNAMIGDTGSVPAQNVWDNNFKMVLHFGQVGNGAMGEFSDSTKNHNNGTGGNGNSASVPTQVDSKIGHGQYFDGDKGYIQIPNSPDFSLVNTGELTVSFWMSPSVLNFPKSSGSGYINFLGKGDPGQYEWVFTLGNQNSADKRQEIAFYIHNAGGGVGTGGGLFHPYKVNDWIYVIGRLDANNVYLNAFYPDGYSGKNYENYHTWGGFEIIPIHGSAPTRIGSWILTDQWYQGVVDEVQVSGVYRSDAWVKASYYSENDNLINFGVSVNLPPVLSPINDKSVNAGQTLSFTISATDPDRDDLIYSASNLPSGASFDPTTRTFSWTPRSDQVGTYPDVHFEVSDGRLTTTTEVLINVFRESQPATESPTATIKQSPVGGAEKEGVPIVLYVIGGVLLIGIGISIILLSRTRWIKKQRR